MSEYVFSADEQKLSDILKARLKADENKNEYISAMAIASCHHTGEKNPPGYYISKALATVREIGDYILSLREEESA